MRAASLREPEDRPGGGAGAEAAGRRPAPSGRRAGLCIFAILLAFFLLLFSQFPASGRLPGNCDTWYAITFTNLYLNEVRSLLDREDLGRVLYPAPSPFAYGETSVALALFPMLLRAAGIGEVMTYYLFISIVYAVTGLAVYLVATLYVGPGPLSALAGLAFAASNFLLSTADSPHTTFLGIAFLSVYFFKRFLTLGRTRDLWWSALLAGAQTYFSAYVFLLLAVTLALLGVMNLRDLTAGKGAAKRLAGCLCLVAAMAAPFYLYYLVHLTDYFGWRRQAVLFAEFNSLDPADFLNPMPGNLLYPEGHRFDHRDAMVLQRRFGREVPAGQNEEFALMVGAMPRADEESLWVSSRKRAFIGISLYALALAGAWSPFRGRRELLALIPAGLVPALGPAITWGGTVVRTPLFWLYEYLPGFHMFRIPGRAFSLSLLAIVVLAAAGLGSLVRRFVPASTRGPLFASMLAGALVVIENVPFPMRSFEAAAFATPPEEYRRFFAERARTVVLNLPSGIGYGLAGSADDLNVFNREIIYMNWQTYHGQNVVNGVNGYIPMARIAVQRRIAGLPGEEGVAELAAIGVEFIAFNKGLVLPGEAELLEGLRRTPSLAPVLESETTTVFKILR